MGYLVYPPLARYRDIRTPTKPSTAKCDLDRYTFFLLAEPRYAGCSRLAEILKELSHDSVNRFLLRERYEPKDLFEEVKSHLNLIGGTVSIDDAIADKPYSDPAKAELIGYFWSGKHHRVVKGVCLITLYYTDPEGRSMPVNYRLYDKRDGKTKNDYFREMLPEVLEWGIKPFMATGDAWYASRQNLKVLRNQELGFVMGIAKNRQVSLHPGEWVQVQTLEIPDEGLVVQLKQFGRVKVFQRRFKNEQQRYYLVYLPDSEQLDAFGAQEFRDYHSIHWGIECYHRAIKQVCGLERFMVRTTEAIQTHIFCVLRAFTQLELMRIGEVIENWYGVQRNLYLQVTRDFILKCLSQKSDDNPHPMNFVNA